MATQLLHAARALGMIAACIVLAAPVHAQERRHEERRDFGHERYANPHWVYDDRFHHNHYYPAAGYSVNLLPPGNIGITFRGGRLFFHAGVWYQAAGPAYVVVRPPVGVVVPMLPPAYATVWAGGRPYYYANDIYYAQGPGGYVVATPPMEAAAPQPAPLPQQAQGAPAQAPGSWYYCDSARAYYPYVQSCAEGWRTVPAAPPPR
jgi:hypothetical protein